MIAGFTAEIIAVALTFISGVTLFVSWGLRKSFIQRDECVGFERSNEKRLTALETRIDSSPTIDDINNILIQIAKMETDMDRQRDMLMWIQSKLEAITEYLISK